MPRAIVCILDSFGIGGAPDAADYDDGHGHNDMGSDTLGHIAVACGTGLGDSSDVFLGAGQSLPVAAGQSVVVEPLNGRRLQYRWVDGDAASARPASWWRRASVGNGAPAWGDACCA